MGCPDGDSVRLSPAAATAPEAEMATGAAVRGAAVAEDAVAMGEAEVEGRVAVAEKEKGAVVTARATGPARARCRARWLPSD